MTAAPPIRQAPPPPFRGIIPFDYASRGLFFGREAEVEAMLAKILLNRLVVLFGESGTGKSSLVNAGLAPVLERRRMTLERIRVRPDCEEPFIVERIDSGRANEPFLPSIFVPNQSPEAEWPCSMAAFRNAIESACSIDRLTRSATQTIAPWPVLFLDQFEELFTLFGQSSGIEGARERQIQEEIFSLIVAIARSEALRVKIVIGIREDFLGRLEVLAKRFPAVLDHRVRLSSLNRRGACRAILGPFVSRQYESRISPHLTRRIVRDLEEQGTGTAISPTQLQIVCQRLWDVYHGAVAVIGLAEYQELRAVKGIVESFFDSELNAIPEKHRATAVAVLGRLVTASGTRDVVSRDKVREGVPANDADTVLRLLEGRKIVNLKSQRNTDYFEVSSEYLIAPIQAVVLEYNRKRDREQLERTTAQMAQAAAELRYRSRLRYTNWALIALAFGLAAGVFGVLRQSGQLAVALHDAKTQRDNAGAAAREALRLKMLADDASGRAQKQTEVIAAKEKEVEDAAAKAKRNESVARANELASNSLASLTIWPKRALQQALQAVDASPSAGVQPQAVNALQQAVQNSRLLSITSASDPQGVSAMTLTPDGRTAILTLRHSLRLVDLSSGAELRSIPAAYAIPTFSPNGKLVALTLGSIDIYDLATGARRSHSSPWDCSSNSAFTADSRSVACVNRQGKLQVFDAESLQTRVLGEIGSANLLAFSPDGKSFYTIEGGKIVRRLYPETSQTAASANTLGIGPGASIVVSPDGMLLVLSDYSRTRLLKTDDLTPLKFDDRSGVRALPAFSPDGRYLAYTYNRTIYVWNLRTSKPEFTLSWGISSGNTLAFPDNQRLVGLDQEGQVREWSLAPSPNYQLLQLPPYENVLSGDGLRAVSVSYPSHIDAWDVATGKVIASGNLSTNAAGLSVSVDLSGKRIVLGNILGQVSEFDIASGTPSFTFKPTYESPYIYLTSLKSLAYREDGEVLAVVERGDNHTKDLWAARANRLLATLPAELEQFWPAPTGLLTAASGASGPFRIFRGAVAVAELPISPTAVAFDRGGRKVAAASPGGSIWVTDLATAKSTEIKGAGSGVSALALSLDGSLLAGGNSDRELFVWNLNKRKMEYRFGGNDFAIQQLAFTPDSRKITTLAADGTVRVYWLDLDQLKEHARKLLAQWPQ